MCRKLTHLMLALVLVLLTDVASADIDIGLVGYWKLDGNAQDSSGNGFHGEEFGNPSYVSGYIDEALDFDGPEQSVYIPEFTAVQNEGEVTICMWARPDRNTGEDQVMWFTDEDGSYGRVRFGVNGDEWEFKHGGSGANVDVDDGENPMVLGEWVHLVGVRKDNDRLELFVDGRSAEKKTFGVAGVAEPQASIGAERRSATSIRTPFDGVIDEVRFYTRALTLADIKELLAFAGDSPVAASNPDPADGQTDVPRDAVLSWTPGDFVSAINGHKVYIGENFADVNDGIGGVALSTSSYSPPQRLDFSKTYYWRVDEVDGPPDFAVHEGAVWSFTTEPVSYAIDNVVATASSSEAGKGPENTVNGSGLDNSGLLHSDDGGGMWLSSILGQQPTWIQYEFDNVYKLHEMWIWNSNSDLEASLGFGARDVTIEYSVDGIDYMTLGTTHEFARAPGAPGYAHDTTVDFGGMIAKHVRLTVNSSWGGWLPQYGLSEVRFFHIPVRAREPRPDSGAADVDVNVTLGWRAGRQAANHDVYLSTDEQAVTDGTAPVTIVTEASHSPSALDLGTTYYWRVDEVNDSETPPMSQGDIWSFLTQEFIVVDDFESYNDIPAGEEGGNPVYVTWADGFDNPSANGSTIGYTEAFQPSMETSLVYDGGLSVPLFYNNVVAVHSEVTANVADLQAGQDWTGHGIKALTLRFLGDPNNVVQQMYVKINGSKVTYDADVENLKRAEWQMWYIDLASIGVNLSNITGLSIGFERIGAVGGQGMVLLDGIRLYSYDRQLVTPVAPDPAGLVARYELDGNANDSAGTAHGTPTGGLFVTGRFGQAVSLGGNDYVDCGNPSQLDFGTGSWTVSAWVNAPSLTDQMIVFSNGGDNTGGIRYMLSVGEATDHLVTLTVDDNNAKIQSTGSVVVDNGQWHHIVGVRDGSNLRVYVDGVQDGATASLPEGYDLSGTSQANAFIGAGWHLPNSAVQKFFTGAIDEVRVYDYALSPAEILSLTGATSPFDVPF